MPRIFLAVLESYLKCLRAYVDEAPSVYDGLEDLHFWWAMVARSGIAVSLKH